MPSQPPWHAMTAGDVARALGVEPAIGHSSAEAAQRLARDGPNTLRARAGTPAWLRFLAQFNAPLVYILLVATVITLLLGEYLDSAVIFAVVLVNAVIGHAEESRAVKAIDALARSMRIEATVLRDGRRSRIDAAGLVVGDIVLLESGDRVPADLRLDAVRDLHADESMLTGESAPVSKSPAPAEEGTALADRRCMAYAGSLITRGTAAGIVVAVAGATEVGRISALMSSAEQLATPLARQIAAFSKRLLWAILIVAALGFALGVARGNSAADMFMAAVALAVGAIPEGLPAAVTIMLAVGVSRMARRRAIIRKLPAVEALGSTTVICSDKTGTLTQNQMTVAAVWAGGREFALSSSGYDPEGQVLAEGAPVSPGDHAALRETLLCGALCNDAAVHHVGGVWETRGDPTEAALVVSARKAGFSPDALHAKMPRLDAVPFESDRQYMATLNQTPEGPRLFVKGSVERILSMSVDALDAHGARTPLDADAVHDAASRLAERGLRVLAFAGRPCDQRSINPAEVERGQTFYGLQGMFDPPRPEAAEAVAQCRRAGIRVKMITGDHARTAGSIGVMLGIDGAAQVVTGAQMADFADAALPRLAEETAIFARMTPEQKLRLVRALQAGVGGRGHVVAMTGDGVNDAPALRQADIGIAMGLTGTEVAKEAADMVLADDNFASIEAAVEEGRAVYANLTKFIFWTLPTNGGEALVILTAIVLNLPLPIMPVQALYINMSTAILLGMPLVFEAKESDIMARPPRDPRKPLVTLGVFMRTGLVSIAHCVGAIGLFYYELDRGMGEAAARTAAVSTIVVGKAFYLFSARALIRPAWAIPAFSNLWLWAGIAAMLLVQFLFAHLPIFNTLFGSAPLDGPAWARVFVAGGAIFIVVEIEKAIRRARGADE